MPDEARCCSGTPMAENIADGGYCCAKPTDEELAEAQEEAAARRGAAYDETVTIPLLCCKVHGEDVSRCIRAEFVDGMDSRLTKAKARELGRMLYEFLYANAPGDFLDGFIHAARVKRAEEAVKRAQ